MPVDPSISLGVKPVEAPNVLQQAMQAQIMRNQMLSGNQLQQSMGANQAVSQAIQNRTRPDGSVDLAGVQSDLAGNPAAAYNLQETTGTNLTQQNQQIGNAQNQFNLDKSHLDFFVQQMAPLLNDPNLTKDKVVTSAAMASKFANMPAPMTAAFLTSIPDDPAQLRPFVQQRIIAAQDKANELSALTPNVVMANNGQQQVPVNTNPNAGPVGPMAGAGTIQNQLPPTTPTVGGPSGMQPGYVGPQGGTAPSAIPNNNPGNLRPVGATTGFQQFGSLAEGMQALDKDLQAKGTEGLNTVNSIIGKYAPPNENNTAAYISDVAKRLGVAPNQKLDMTNPMVRQALGTAIAIHEHGAAALFGGNAKQGSAAPAQSGFVPSAPPPGAAQNVEGNAATVNSHWDKLSADAGGAQTGIGIAQNIKALADKAITGTEQGKLAFANGILAQFGLPASDDVKTATDLMEKNMQRLALTSRSGAGGTDAAGALAAAANPHGTMSKDAIKDAADQVIGQYNMALAQQKVLQPYKLANGGAGDNAGYQTALTKFNSAADPRVWQFKNMTPEQRQQFKASMSPADQKSFSTKIRILDSLGALQ